METKWTHQITLGNGIFIPNIDTYTHTHSGRERELYEMYSGYLSSKWAEWLNAKKGSDLVEQKQDRRQTNKLTNKSSTLKYTITHAHSK